MQEGDYQDIGGVKIPGVQVGEKRVVLGEKKAAILELLMENVILIFRVSRPRSMKVVLQKSLPGLSVLLVML